VNTGRVTAVNKMESVNPEIPMTSGNEIPSARKRIGEGNNVTGCQAGNARSNGIRASQRKTLKSANNAPLTATSHAYRTFGCVTRKTTSASAVAKSKRQEIKINMEGHNCISFITTALYPPAFGTILPCDLKTTELPDAGFHSGF
jgi:hypothetical protein